MIRTNPLSVKSIENIANEIRNQFGIKIDSYFPILKVLDRLMYQDKLQYQILGDDDQYLEGNTPAKYSPFENIIYIKESVIKEYDEGEYRSSFTLCHELFHYIQVQMLKFDFIEVESCKNYEDVEWQANEFAGQVLIPTEYIDLDEQEIVEKFHVSIECALIRKIKIKQRNAYLRNNNT